MVRTAMRLCFQDRQKGMFDEDLDPHPCEEDEEFFKSRPDAEKMEQAIGKFLYVCYQYILVCTRMYHY